MQLLLIPVEAIGQATESGPVFIDGEKYHSSMTARAYPTYPENPWREKFKAIRQMRVISIPHAAQLLGITPGECGKLELGQYTLPAEQWDWVMDEISFRVVR